MLGVCNEALFPTARPGAPQPGWWAAELRRCSRAGPEVVAVAAVAYRVLAGVLVPAAPGRRDIVQAEARQIHLLSAPETREPIADPPCRCLCIFPAQPSTVALASSSIAAQRGRGSLIQVRLLSTHTETTMD